jgi:AraC family transcriptional regulator, positive regulator of tynA and feaB
MRVLFSTNKVHPRDRLAFWREEACKAFVAHDFTTTVGRNFNGEISATSLGTIPLAKMVGDPCTVTRTRRCLTRATDDDLLLCRSSRGTTRVHQDGRDVITGPGAVWVLDPRRPFKLSIETSCEGIFFKIPRSELEARLGDSATWTALAATASPASSLASEFLVMAAERASEMDHTTGLKIATQALDLIALAFEPVSAQLSSTRATTLVRLKTIIESRLHDPTLKPAIAAAATGISVRYANALLACEGTSLERYIMSRRLQRCYQQLQCPAHLSRTIGDIAYGLGFADLSHFTRRFRQEFGCSPGDVRPRIDS